MAIMLVLPDIDLLWTIITAVDGEDKRAKLGRTNMRAQTWA
jgi:hypothetical protein